MRTLMSVILSLLLAGMAVAMQTVPPEFEMVVFESKKGNVTFKHKLHADMTITTCNTCHHTYDAQAGTPIKPCRECHVKKSTDDAPSEMKAFHLRCQGCHQYTVDAGGKAGPLKKECKLCHIK